MVYRLFLMLSLLSLSFYANARGDHHNKIHYALMDDPIDVVIVSHPKDKETLDYCIDGIKENCSKIRRVIVVSSEKLTDKAEWFNERKYPFTIEDVALAIGRGDKAKRDKFFHYHCRPPGWYLQQLLKLYAPFVIPDISSNVLVLDADAIFMNPVEFLNDSNGGLFCVSHERAKSRYINHAERLLPEYKRVHPNVYSICHHMLFQKAILEDLFRTVEEYHHKSFWKAFCYAINLETNRGASEYEVYFNFALRHTDQVEIRELEWKNSSELNKRDKFKDQGYQFVAFHTYMRDKDNPYYKRGSKHF